MHILQLKQLLLYDITLIFVQYDESCFKILSISTSYCQKQHK